MTATVLEFYIAAPICIGASGRQRLPGQEDLRECRSERCQHSPVALGAARSCSAGPSSCRSLDFEPLCDSYEMLIFPGFGLVGRMSTLALAEKIVDG